MSSYYTYEELKKIGFLSIGKDVLISKKSSIYGAENISIGNHVRIDDYCVLSGKIKLGNYIHIAVFSCLFGGTYGIEMQDYTCLSSRCAVYAITDDYSGNAMTNPMVPDAYRNVIGNKVILEKHVLIGSGSTILPGVLIGEGTSVGSMSLVRKPLDAWGIYCGIPCKKIKNRSKRLIELENKLLLNESEHKG